MRAPIPLSPLAPGQILARGVCRALAAHNFAPLTEFVPAPGLRVDIIALGPKGEVWVIECKSSRADFVTDHKWQGYLDWCDRFFWAVAPDFPTAFLPQDQGLFLADGYGAELCRLPSETPLAPARRKALTLAIARQSMARLHRVADPGQTEV
jgi:hypothetical protein